jgi:hypothetical protein
VREGDGRGDIPSWPVLTSHTESSFELFVETKRVLVSLSTSRPYIEVKAEALAMGKWIAGILATVIGSVLTFLVISILKHHLH